MQLIFANACPILNDNFREEIKQIANIDSQILIINFKFVQPESFNIDLLKNVMKQVKFHRND
jgi:hypothetical protein